MIFDLVSAANIAQYWIEKNQNVMLHKVKAIDYIQVCADRLAEVTAKQHDTNTEPVLQGLFDNNIYTSTAK